MKFKVRRYWSVCDLVEVEASSVSVAIDLAHELPADNARAEFVSNSMNTNPDSEVWPQGAEGTT